jgi:tetraacyldisaccharide 4'-kinase
LYQRGTFKTAKLPRPVISVGNITTGGTGKTPLVEFVARTLADEGKKVCILTRGYRRKNPGERVLVSDGTTVFSSPAEAGDEPYLLASNLVGRAAVVSDANRFAAGEGAIKHLATDCFVLDDGFQHLQLARNLDIVTVDATNPFGGGQLLPYGRLREDVSGLKRADCFVLTRCDQVNTVNAIQQELAKLSGDRPVFLSRMSTSRIAPLSEDDAKTPTDPVAAFCAIGNPESFFKHLALNGCDPVLRKAFRDHHAYSQSDIESVVAAAKQSGAKSLITTAKDAVKLRPLQFSLPCYSLDVEIKIDNEEGFKRLVLSAD